MKRDPKYPLFYGIFYDRSIELEQRPRLRERKMRKREIAKQRAIAYDVHGCGDMVETCTYPNCMCYPFWRSKYRHKIEQKEALHNEPQYAKSILETNQKHPAERPSILASMRLVMFGHRG